MYNQVRWGDKKGGYGEHYWDLNHAGHAGHPGHAGDHGDESYDSPDDSSYHEDREEPYEEPSEQVHKYEEEGYGPEYPSKYDEPNRSKRANSKRNIKKAKGEQDRQKAQEKTKKDDESMKKPVEEYDAEASEEETYEMESKQKPHRIEEYKSENPVQQREKNHVVLILSQKEKSTPVTGDQMPHTKEVKHYVPYEGGAGVRQHQYPEVTPAAAPRLFLEPSTGHVVDRATGQAYVLQPLVQKPSSS